MVKFVQVSPSRMIKSQWNKKRRSSSSWPVITRLDVSSLLFFTSCRPGRGFQIQFDGIRAYIRLDPSYVNNTRGLCGTYDFNSQNDFLTHIAIVETDIKTFVDDYKTDIACPTPTQQHPCQQNVVVCQISEKENETIHCWMRFSLLSMNNKLKLNVRSWNRNPSPHVHQRSIRLNTLTTVNSICVPMQTPTLRMLFSVRQWLPMHETVVWPMSRWTGSLMRNFRVSAKILNTDNVPGEQRTRIVRRSVLRPVSNWPIRIKPAPNESV